MSPRAFALAFLVIASPVARGQDAFDMNLGGGHLRSETTRSAPDARSAWLDLRQSTRGRAPRQTAPAWVKSVTMLPRPSVEGVETKTVFRIELARPLAGLPLLMCRLFFDDKPELRPRLIAVNEAGSLVLQTPPLGAGLSLSTSETVMIPAAGSSTIDVEVPGDGTTMRGAYLDWMAPSEVVRPVEGDTRSIIPETFGGDPALSTPDRDNEKFGTVTAILASETIAIGPTLQQGAAFQFPLEEQPLVAMLTFEVASAYVDAPPEISVNGESLGPVSIALPELSDPAYRGEMKPLVRQMRFQYTGWLRAQKLIPASSLRAGTNDLLVIGGPGTTASAIRATQIQLKYPWEKLDYQLIPGR